MSKHYLKPIEDADISGCKGCTHYYPIDIFELCRHKQAEYEVGGGEREWHTCRHMRAADEACGPDMKLRQKNSYQTAHA